MQHLADPPSPRAFWDLLQAIAEDAPELLPALIAASLSSSRLHPFLRGASSREMEGLLEVGGDAARKLLASSRRGIKTVRRVREKKAEPWGVKDHVAILERHGLGIEHAASIRSGRGPRVRALGRGVVFALGAIADDVDYLPQSIAVFRREAEKHLTGGQRKRAAAALARLDELHRQIQLTMRDLGSACLPEHRDGSVCLSPGRDEAPTANPATTILRP